MRWSVLAILAFACDHTVTVGSNPTRILKQVPTSPDLDVLFVIDNSSSTQDKQALLLQDVNAFVARLDAFPSGRPDLHIGVVTTTVDQGPVAAMLSPSGCPSPNLTSDGRLQPGYGSAAPSGRYIIDLAGPNGSASPRTTNYPGTLEDAFSSIAEVGAAGCGFEAPLLATQRALDGTHPDNADFLRPDADLAIVILTDEDDCSLEHADLLTSDLTTLGPLQSFRCTRFGVTCDEGGTTTDAMNQVGPKGKCHASTTSPYLADVQTLAEGLQGLKGDPSQVMVAAIAGNPSPFEIELRAPAGSGTPIPALAHSCQYAGNDGPAVADPAARLADFVSQFGSRGAFESVCNADLTLPLTQIGISTRQMMGDGCLAARLADTRGDQVGVQPMCEVVDGEATLPSCDTAPAGQDCWLVLADPNRCPASPDNLRIEIQRSEPQVTQRYTHVKCLTAD